MKYIDADLIKSTQSLYSDIDSCIGELLKARVEHNQENEGKALYRMEGLMVGTLQQLSCILDTLLEEPDKSLEEELKKEIEKKYDQAKWGYVDGFGAVVMDKCQFIRIARHFAEWQKEQDLVEMAQSKSTLSIAYANRCFENGKQAMKEQMMKDAVDADVNTYKDLVSNCGWAEFVVDMPSVETDKFGDKVKIIIIKEEKNET